MSSAGPPTLAGFQAFVSNTMLIPDNALPPGSQVITDCFNYALEVVNRFIACVAPISYTNAVYNFAAATLIATAPDQTAQNYFVELRNDLKIDSFVPGVISASSDVSTSQSMEVAEAFKNVTIGDLQLLKTPWGRAYLAIAQKFGNLWGIT